MGEGAPEMPEKVQSAEGPVSVDEAFDKAYDEAALMKAFISETKLKEKPVDIAAMTNEEAFDYIRKDRRLTKEDYKTASDAIDELRDIAATETDRERQVARLKRLVENVRRAGEYNLDLLGTVFGGSYGMDRVMEKNADRHASRIDALTLASEKLEQLREKAGVE